MRKVEKKRRRLYKREILKAVKDSGGFVTEIARRLDCDVSTVHRWKRKDDDIYDAIEEEREATLDLAEKKLIDKIRAGNLSAIIFYLKTQGRKRGYGDRTDIGILDPKVELNAYWEVVPAPIVQELPEGDGQ